MRNNKQVRTMAGSFNARIEGSDPIIEGKFISFEGEYQIAKDMVETISPMLEIEGDDIRALIDHETRLVLGRTTAGTLELQHKEDGIYGIVKVNPNDQDAMNLYARVERGDVSQCSFGFSILSENTEVLEDGMVKWTIEKIRLYEVSVVTFPAYEDTGVSARAEDGKRLKTREFEAWKNRLMAKLP